VDEMTLYTAGYEGCNISDFISKLQANGIKVVIDIREIPISRKKGFSKAALKEILTENNIEYIHYKELGSPKDIRHKLHEDGDFKSFINQYLAYVKDKKNILDEVRSIVENQSSCLLCFEKAPRQCHRSVVADLLYASSNSIMWVIDI